MPVDYTPDEPGVLVESDPRAWRNDRYPAYVVQARSRDECAFEHEGIVSLDEKLEAFQSGDCKFMVQRRQEEIARLKADGQCPCDVHAPDCPGTGKQARYWSCLARKDALHAIYGHYLFPNLSLHRFKSHARGTYAIDLVFEIDVHGTVEPFQPMRAYEPLIAAAVGIGRRIYDFLTCDFGVPAGYITTSITRMGARVTVDWRAFGSRKSWELVALIRWIEAQLFGPDEFAILGDKLKASVAIDTGVYGTNDTPRIDSDGVNLFKGGWLRPLGATHTKSSNAMGWFRTTPVAHDRFRENNTEWLTRVSRSKYPDLNKWAEPDLLKPSNFGRWPEARFPAADKLVEGVLPPAVELIRLLDDDTTIASLPPKERATVERMRLRSTGTRASSSVSIGQIDRNVVAKVLEYLGIPWDDQGDHARFNCPRVGCKSRDKKAAMFFESGVFHCFRCCRPEMDSALSLQGFASEMGCSHLVPWSRANSKPVAWVSIADAPTHDTDVWPTFVNRVDVSAASLEEGRQIQERQLHDFLSRDNERVLVLASGTGVGKTTAAARAICERELRCRAFAGRDDSKAQLAELLPGAKIIVGRRAGDNCTNPDLDEVSTLLEPIGKTLCCHCQDREKCEASGYLSQFEEEFEGHIILHHNVGVMDDLEMFDNHPDVDLVDEDPLSSTLQHIDLGPGQLARMLVRLQIVTSEAAQRAQHQAVEFLAREYPEQRSLYLGQEESIFLDDETEVLRVESSAALGALVRGLIKALDSDSVVERAPDATKRGHLRDLALAKYLYSDYWLHEAWDLSGVVGSIDDDDTSKYAECKNALLDLSRLVTYPVDAEPGTVRWVPRRTFLEPYERRPPNVLKELLDALRSLLADFELGRSRTSPLQVIKDDRGDWIFRLTIKRPFLSRSGKIIQTSATMTPERLRLTYGEPLVGGEWRHVRVQVPDPLNITYLADHSYATGSLMQEKQRPFRDRLFETTKKLVDVEFKRTGIPVAVLGPSRVINTFVEGVVDKLPSKLSMPWSGDRRERFRELSELTRPHGFVAGYAYGSSGLNIFGEEQDGAFRFVRSLIVLGNPVPNLGDVAATHHGLYSDQYDLVPDQAEGFDFSEQVPAVVDWTIVQRDVSFSGNYPEGKVLVRRNVIGFADERANSILRGLYEAELIQMLGRMRSVIPDPIDPRLEPRAFIIAGVPLPGVMTREVTTLERLRQELGLEHKVPAKKGRRPNEDWGQRFRDLFAMRRKQEAVEVIILHLKANGEVVTRESVRSTIESLGFRWTNKEKTICSRISAAGMLRNSL